MSTKEKATDWRAAMMERVRTLINEADPKITEERKYKMPSNPAGIPVWYRDGMICTGETYKNHLRLTFAKGPKIKDPKKLFNKHRAIVIEESDRLNAAAFKQVIREAVKLNQQPKASKARTKPKTK